jgi:hypothetical protein
LVRKTYVCVQKRAIFVSCDEGISRTGRAREDEFSKTAITKASLGNVTDALSYMQQQQQKTTSVALVRERTTPTERKPFVGEVSVNCG